MPLAAAAATGVLVGSGIVATRFALAQAGPASLALLRYAIGFCCILPVALMGPRVRFARRDLLPIALLGIAQFGILVALLNLALEYIPSARAALLLGGLAVVPAAAQTAPAPAAKAPAKHATHHAGHHVKSCYDYAWESQAQKDCLAKQASAPAPAKKAAKSKKKTT